MKPKHQSGYMVLRHKRRAVASTIDLSWLMSMPEWRRNKFLRDWEVILICNGH